MSTTTTEPIADAATPRPKRRVPWIQLALVCAALLAAGGARIRRAKQIGDFVNKGRVSPFPLKELPRDLGPWRGGDEASLDPLIANAAGSTDHLGRVYVDERTGTKLVLLILYGPATGLHYHAPELCYPKAGYAQGEGPIRRTVDFDGNRKATFSSLIFTRGEGGAAERQLVYYAWRYGDLWAPAALSPRLSERTPGMFKLQVSRSASPREHLRTDGAIAEESDADPCESFLKLVLPEIERRIAAKRTESTQANERDKDRRVSTASGIQAESSPR